MPSNPNPNPQAQLWPGAEEAARFFQLAFGELRGWLEISTIEGDPDDKDHSSFRQRWFPYAPDRMEQLLRLVEDLFRRYGNVYCSVTLYSRDRRPRKDEQALPEGKRSIALPGYLVFVDDVADGECSYIVRTGTGKPQAIVLLDAPADADIRHDLAVRIAAAYGGDPSGTDRVQIMRIPGTINTKRRHGGQYSGMAWIPGTGYHVRLEEGSGQTYTVEDLHTRLPEVPQSILDNTQLLKMDDVLRQAVGNWCDRIDQLLESPRLQSIKRDPRRNIARVLMGERVTIRWRTGYRDSSEAAQRAVLADGLVFFGLPDDEVLAIVLESEWWEGSEHEAWMESDALTVLQHAREKYPDRVPSPTRNVGGNMPRTQRQDALLSLAAPAVQVAEPQTVAIPTPKTQPPTPIAGRPSALTPDEYVGWLLEASDGRNAEQQLIVLRTQQMAADELGVSKSTIERCERALRAGGQIRREVLRQGVQTTSWVVILSLVRIPSVAVVTPGTAVSSEPAISENIPRGMFPLGHFDVAQPEMPEPAAPMPAEEIAAPEPEALVVVPPSPDCLSSVPSSAAEVDGMPTAPTPNSQLPTLTDLVRDAVDAYGPGFARTLRYIADNGQGKSWPKNAVKRGYDAEIQRRKLARKEAQVVTEARAMRWSELKRRATSAGGWAAELRRRGNNRWRYWNWYAGQLEAEITRRTEGNPGLS